MDLEGQFPAQALTIKSLRSMGIPEDAIYNALRGKVESALKAGATPKDIDAYLYSGPPAPEPGLGSKILNVGKRALDIAALPATLPVSGALGFMSAEPEKGQNPYEVAAQKMWETLKGNAYTPGQYVEEQSGQKIPWYAGLALDLPAYYATGGLASEGLRALLGGGKAAIQAGQKMLGPGQYNMPPSVKGELPPYVPPGLPPGPTQGMLPPGQQRLLTQGSAPQLPPGGGPAGLLQSAPFYQGAAQPRQLSPAGIPSSMPPALPPAPNAGLLPPFGGYPMPGIPPLKALGGRTEPNLLGPGRIFQMGEGDPVLRGIKATENLEPVERTLNSISPARTFPHTQPLLENPVAVAEALPVSQLKSGEWAVGKQVFKTEKEAQNTWLKARGFVEEANNQAFETLEGLGRRLAIIDKETKQLYRAKPGENIHADIAARVTQETGLPWERFESAHIGKQGQVLELGGKTPSQTFTQGATSPLGQLSSAAQTAFQRFQLGKSAERILSGKLPSQKELVDQLSDIERIGTTTLGAGPGQTTWEQLASTRLKDLIARGSLSAKGLLYGKEGEVFPTKSSIQWNLDRIAKGRAERIMRIGQYEKLIKGGKNSDISAVRKIDGNDSRLLTATEGLEKEKSLVVRNDQYANDLRRAAEEYEMFSGSGTTLYGGIPGQAIWEQAKGRARDLMNIFDRNLGSPYFVLANDPLGKLIVDRIYEATRQSNSFLRWTAGQFLPSTKGVKKFSDIDNLVGDALDKAEKVNFGDKTAQRLFDGYRNFMDWSRDQLIKRGHMTEEEAIKGGYFHRLFSKTQDPEIWEAGVRADITNLKAELDVLKSTGQKVPAEKVQRLARAQQALDHWTTSGAIFWDYVPTKSYAPFLKQRLGAEGFDRSAVNSWHSYAHQFEKTVYRSPAAQEALTLANQIADPNMRAFAKTYIKRFMDAPNFERTWQRSLDGASRLAMSLEWMKDMGLNFRSVLINSTQILNEAFDSGPQNIFKGLMQYAKNEIVPGTEGIRIAPAHTSMAGKIAGGKVPRAGWELDPKSPGITARELFNWSGHGQDIPWQFQYKGYDPLAGGVQKHWETLQEKAGYLYNKVESGNRAASFMSGWNLGRSQGLTKFEDLVNFADAQVLKNQFQYGKIGSPMIASSPIGRAAMQFATFPIKQLERYRTWATEGPKGIGKLVGYLTFAEVAMGKGMESLGVDLSTAVGLGFNYDDMVKGLSSYFVEGDTERAKAHFKMAAPGLYGGPGGGILPSGFFPAYQTLKNVLNADFYRLIPVQIGRVIDATRAINEGETFDPVTGEQGFALRGAYGGPKEQEKKGTVSGGELIQRTIGPKLAKEYSWQLEDFKEKQEKQYFQRMTKKIKSLMASGTDKDVELAFSLMEKTQINPFAGKPDISGEVGIEGRRILRDRTKAGQRRIAVFGGESE